MLVEAYFCIHIIDFYQINNAIKFVIYTHPYSFDSDPFKIDIQEIFKFASLEFQKVKSLNNNAHV